MAPRTINQFMWGYQHVFRSGVEYEVERTLATIGAPMPVRVVLVGFRTNSDGPHDICVEPETGAPFQTDFARVLARAEELFAEDPEARIRHSHTVVQQRHTEWLRYKSRAAAVVEAFEASGAALGWRIFASASAPIGGYQVHTCIGVDADMFDSLPSLEGDMFDRVYVGRSFPQEVIAECLRRADRALYLPDPGAGLESLGPSDEIVRTAARTFTQGCVVRSGELLAGEPFDALNDMAAVAYERLPAQGRLFIVNPDHPRLRPTVRLRHTVRLAESRGARKLLETSDGTQGVLTDGRRVFGIGDVVDGDEGPDVFEVAVLSHATWELRKAGVGLMRVSYGRASLPRPLLDRSRFDDVVGRVIGGADNDHLWSLVDAAAAGGHGTTIVISAGAEAEALRLSGQATVIHPATLAEADVVRLGRIDGAALVDPEGRCHAVGAILDGEASGQGDPGRGSRYNSSVRYQATAEPATVVVVVSEDGSVDLIPDLRPRVHRDDVDAAVSDFISVATAEPVPGESFARAYNRIRRLAFYLSADQCHEVNRLFQAEQERRLASGGIAISETPLKPDPEMDDRYFFD